MIRGSTDIRADVEEVKEYLARTNPFAYALVSAATIIASRVVETAAATSRAVVVNPEFFAELSLEEKARVLAHEALHLALRHPARGSSMDPFLRYFWGISCDIVVGEILRRIEGDTRQVYYALDVNEIFKDLEELLACESGRRPPPKGEVEAVLVQEGDDAVFEDPDVGWLRKLVEATRELVKSGKEVPFPLKRELASIVEWMAESGKLTDSLRREVEEILGL